MKEMTFPKGRWASPRQLKALRANAEVSQRRRNPQDCGLCSHQIVHPAGCPKASGPSNPTIS